MATVDNNPHSSTQDPIDEAHRVAKMWFHITMAGTAVLVAVVFVFII